MFGRRKNFFGLNNLDSLFNDMNSIFDEPFVIKGKSNVENGSDENGDWTKQTFTSNDGSYSITSVVRYYSGEQTPSKNTDELSKLKFQLNKAIEEQEFEEAAKLRDQIKSLELNREKINDLKHQLDEAVKNEDFEKAIQLRDEIKKINS
jgi:excinuclease UvrABC helicase subunit UvrB